MQNKKAFKTYLLDVAFRLCQVLDCKIGKLLARLHDTVNPDLNDVAQFVLRLRPLASDGFHPGESLGSGLLELGGHGLVMLNQVTAEIKET